MKEFHHAVSEVVNDKGDILARGVRSSPSVAKCREWVAERACTLERTSGLRRVDYTNSLRTDLVTRENKPAWKGYVAACRAPYAEGEPAGEECDGRCLFAGSAGTDWTVGKLV